MVHHLALGRPAKMDQQTVRPLDHQLNRQLTLEEQVKMDRTIIIIRQITMVQAKMDQDHPALERLAQDHLAQGQEVLVHLLTQLRRPMVRGIAHLLELHQLILLLRHQLAMPKTVKIHHHQLILIHQ